MADQCCTSMYMREGVLVVSDIVLKIKLNLKGPGPFKRDYDVSKETAKIHVE